jgi:hypothetical protein
VANQEAAMPLRGTHSQCGRLCKVIIINLNMTQYSEHETAGMAVCVKSKSTSHKRPHYLL